jgi:hypothetical protein
LATGKAKRKSVSSGVGSDEIKRLFQDLTGQDAPLPWNDQASVVATLLNAKTGIGWTQFNEVLLLIGYDRVTREFFQFLADGTLSVQPRVSIKSVAQFREGVRRVQEMSLLFFGNLKFGFKVLSRDQDMLALRFAAMEPRSVETFPIEQAKTALV